MPSTRHEMRRAGYEFIVARPCKGRACGRPIEIWKSTNGAVVAFDANVHSDHQQMMNHLIVCPSREELREQARRNRPKCAAPAVTASPAGSGVSNAPGVPLLHTREMERELVSLRQRSGAIAAVLVYETASICAWKVPLDPEDARNSLIAAANFTRNAIRAERAGKTGE